MRGMNKDTGKPVDGDAHVLQSVRDIITTPRGTRVMLRDYGCAMPDLVDSPMNELFQLEMAAAIAEALARWEPRFLLTIAKTEGRNQEGRVLLTVEGRIIGTNELSRIEGITL